MHAALGDPQRLAIADELTAGDRSPGWFAERWGLASNLLAHHVRILVEAGLVERRRSEGDGRRVYLHLTRAGRSMAGLIPVTAERVVFVCTHNSARSQFAEALWRGRSGIPATSGGTHPADRVHPAAVRVASRRGLDLSRATPRPLHPRDIAGALVVTVCDNADEETSAPHVHWSVPDPVAAGRDDAFETAFDDIAVRVETLAALTDTEQQGV